MRIMGIDPSYVHTGWAILEDDARGVLRLISHGIVICNDNYCKGREDIKYKQYKEIAREISSRGYQY